MACRTVDQHAAPCLQPLPLALMGLEQDLWTNTCALPAALGAAIADHGTEEQCAAKWLADCGPA